MVVKAVTRLACKSLLFSTLPILARSTTPSFGSRTKFRGMDRDGFRKAFTVLLRPPHGLFKRKRPKEPLLQRAWVFQEQILSPRIIHIASGELFFECRSHIVCECSGWSLRLQSWEWETRWRKAQAVLVNRGTSRMSGLSMMRQTLRDFEAYKTLIETYTELDITADLDRLPALSGLTFGRKDEYLAGMWRSFLLLAMHWVPASQTLRGIMARRPYEYRAPTWSWASMEAPIRHIGAYSRQAPFDAKLEAKIINAWCTPEGSDPRGRVKSGYLRVKAPVCTAKVVHIGICERKGWGIDADLENLAKRNPDAIDRSLVDYKEGKLCTYATLRKGNQEGRCYLDVPLVLGRRNPAEVVIGCDVVCLTVSEMLILILRPTQTKSDVFYRVGLLWSQNEPWTMRMSDILIY